MGTSNWLYVKSKDTSRLHVAGDYEARLQTFPERHENTNKHTKSRLFSLRAGGVGVNLTSTDNRRASG
jgi:hypothetical protein